MSRGPVEFHGIVPEDLALGLLRDGVRVEVRQRRLGVGCIGVGVVGVPHDVLPAVRRIHRVLQCPLVAVAGHVDLAVVVLRGRQGQRVRVEEHAVSAVGVVVHAAEPEGEPADVGLEDGEAERGEALQDAGEDEVAHGGHVVEGEAQSVVQPRQGSRYAVVVAQVPEGLGATLAVLAVGGDGEVQVHGELPQRIVLRVVDPLALRQQRVADRDGAELVHRPAGLGHDVLDVGAGQDRGELEALGVFRAVVVTPVVVGPGQGGANAGVLQRRPHDEVAVVARGQAHLDVPAELVHVLQADVGPPPLSKGLAVLLFQARPDVGGRRLRNLALG